MEHGEWLSGQPLVDYLGTHLQVNYVQSAAGKGTDITLTNDGPRDIPPNTQWNLYFNHYVRTYIALLLPHYYCDKNFTVRNSHLRRQ